ncbi:MAG: ScyD/ScyE family protein, partial [Solirubrobacteraceae bacterium]
VVGVAAMCAAVVASLLVAGTASASRHRHVAPKVEVVATGLNSPKHLTFGPGGLYIAQSGTGGPVGSNCVAGVGVTGAPTTFCEGPTGSVGLLTPSGVRTVLGGLPSVTEQDNQETLGPADVTFLRHGRFGHSKMAVLFQDLLVNSDGTSGTPSPASTTFGKLLLANPLGSTLGPTLANLAAFASANPQDPATLGGLGETTYDSDPYDITPYRGGYAIADAAANAVLWLSPHGHLSLITRLPTTPETVPAGALGPTALTIDAQAVPTSIAVGRDGALYVGTLRGVPSLPGTADVYRVVPGHAPVAAVTGLSAVTDVAFDHEGRLLVLEYNTGGLLAPETTPGALLRVELHRRSAPVVTTLPVSGLFAPTGLAVSPGRDGAVYISNHGTSPGTASPSGELLRITGLR